MYSCHALLDQDLLFSPWRLYHKPFWCWKQATRPISQIPQCTCPISHNAPFCNRYVHTCAHFCYKMVHCMVLNIERQKSRSTLVQVVACCLTAPSHWLNSYGLIISEVCWHSPEGNLTGYAQVSIPDLSFEIVNSPPPKQNGRDFADVIFRCIFLMKNFVVWLKFHWSIFLRVRLTITQHWFRQWLGAE